jgi:short-subunit dehydrogenase involved in D-alanine esterification of teichoic acids
MQKELAKEKGNFKGIQCDITQEDDIINAFKWIENNWGEVNILINNAGYLAMIKLHGDN